MEQVTAATLKQAGKVVAVHLAYQSRAEQRGRTPAKPSYFLKASSSLSLSGSAIERPAGCELLAYEGEIALVIGTAARRVSLENAWQHVGHITASNDLGVYDLKYADKGSNVRSKSGDGFTPFGPGLIPAADVDPAGTAAQENGSQDHAKFENQLQQHRTAPFISARKSSGGQEACIHLPEMLPAQLLKSTVGLHFFELGIQPVQQLPVVLAHGHGIRPG